MKASDIFFAWSPDRVNTLPSQARPNERISLEQLAQRLCGDMPPAEYMLLPEYAKKAYAGDAEAKKQLTAAKMQLPYFLASGFCPTHHRDDSLEYNGILQIDIDFKTAGGDDKAAETLRSIHALCPPGIVMAALSPSTFGVKILLWTDNTEKVYHALALQAGIKYLSMMLDTPEDCFDKLGASQPVYAPYEREPGQMFYNPEAQPLHFDPNYKESTMPAGIQSDDAAAIQAAQYIIDNRLNVATHYHEYLKVMAACKNTFGDAGKSLAIDILGNSPQFAVSEFSKWIDRKWDSLKQPGSKHAGPATLVWLANQHGFKFKKPTSDTVRVASPVLITPDGEVLELPKVPVQDYKFELDLKKEPPSKVEAMTNAEFDAYVKKLAQDAFAGEQEEYTFSVMQKTGYGHKTFGVGFPGALIPIFGAQKSRKTSLLASIIAATLKENYSNNPFQFRAHGPVFWYDTEQAPFWFAKVVNRVLTPSGKTAADVADQFYPSRIKHLHFMDRVRFIDRMVKMYKPGIIVIDGIKDLGKDYNSLEESTFMGEVIGSWQEQGCMIFPVLHLTKGDKTPRGHLGNTMLDKCDASISTELVGDSTIEVRHYNSRGAKFDPFIMYADDNNVLTTTRIAEEVPTEIHQFVPARPSDDEDIPF
jgi:hypothetical protein